MKQLIKQNLNRRTLLGALVIISSLCVQSCKDNEQEKWVDLRYKAEDSYTIAADGSDPVNIQVKSTEPWTVFSEHNDWCTITPATGEAGKLYEVEIRYLPNTELDDRTDMITIKSDYWTGKEVTVIQKGIAYLRIKNHENTEEAIEFDKERITLTLNIEANQKWSAAITKGEEWLSFSGGNTGNLDGNIRLEASENKGEQRTGEIVFYDRHNEVAVTLTCVQEGIILNPETSVLKIPYGTETVTLPVFSNGEWVVEKENTDDNWYSFNETEYNGDGTISIHISEQNEGSSVRSSKFKIRNKAESEDVPVEKIITLKLGYKVESTRNAFIEKDWTVTAGTPTFNNGEVTFTPAGSNCRISREGMKPGYYTFHIKSSAADAKCQLYFLYETVEVRWMLFKGGGDNARCGIYDPNDNNLKVVQIPFDDSNQSYSMGLNILAGSTTGSIDFQWTLNGNELRAESGYTGVAYGTNAQIILGVTPAGGAATYDYWEYTAPVNWGED
ncbi:BACON domain-containing protein [uncultured Bacteroides sp.]|uniref:BACON domain-containing protein n=1 Tax=uncultured Bacteroides sp. TaxID=162156 RepID=UPI0026765DC2|nr:BACON domain-containing protein [uncultured Bacteroides sp.]